MVVDVLVYRIDTGYGVHGGLNFQAGYFIHVRLDDSTNTIDSYLATSSVEGGGTVIGTITTGPNLYFPVTGSVTLLTSSPYYSYCDGLDLKTVNVIPTVPYGGLSTNYGASECAIAPVCDLEITSTVIVPSSAPSSSDGEITVTATSSNGPVKYNINSDFDYATEGSTSGNFTGLLSANYTIWVRDSLSSCVRSITVTVTITEVYGERFVMEYDDANGNQTKVSIFERAYEGEPAQNCMGAESVQIEWNGDENDHYAPVVPSNAVLQLLQVTEDQFVDLFGADDRKYKVIIYKDSGSGYVAKWCGFILPEFLSQPYWLEPFETTVTISDGLGELANLPFIDNSAQYTNNEGNNFTGRQKAIKLIAEIIKKTPTGFGIRSTVDIWETTMDTDLDPLDQVYINTDIYYIDETKDCFYVLQDILKPFKARVCMSDGYWWIKRNEQWPATMKGYREFDVNGDFVSDGDAFHLQQLNRPRQDVFWINKSQGLNYLRNYGRFVITQNLSKDGAVIDGNFEQKDIVGDFFKEWQFFMGQTGMTFGLQTVDNGDSKGAFFAKYASNTSEQVDSILYSAEVPIDIEDNGLGTDREVFVLKVDVFVEKKYPIWKWARLGYRIRFTDIVSGDFYDAIPPWGENLSVTVNEERINDIYIDSFGEWKTLQAGPFGLGFNPSQYTVSLAFYFNNSFHGDFQDFDDLRALDTIGRNDWIGKRVTLWDNPGTSEFYTYELTYITEVESAPDIIRPDDYNVVTWPYQWVRSDTQIIPGGVISKIQIDNTKLIFYPEIDSIPRTDPPETATYSNQVNPFIKSVYIDETNLGDLPVFNNSKLVYNSWLSRADGTPTTIWNREGLAEDLPILQIALNDIVAQLTSPVRRLQGTVKSVAPISFINGFNDYLDNKRYLPARMVCYDKRQEYDVTLTHIIVGIDGEPPALIGEFSDDYSDDFNN